jgi:membrane protease YdiL (CAAX protease family)
VPHAQFVLVPNESAAGLLMPVPFVAEAIGGVIDRNVAEGLEDGHASIAPYRIALAAMQGSPLFRARGGGLTLKPFVFITECVDDRYRIASVFQLDGGGWIGRSTVQLRTTYALDAFKQLSAATLATLQAELTEAAARLRGLVERGARGELGSASVRAEVGSLHLVGGKSAGLLSPTRVRAKDAEVIEETADRIILRLPGLMGMAGTSGGLFSVSMSCAWTRCTRSTNVERRARPDLSLPAMNQRLAVSLATFLGWMLITLVGEQFGAGTHQALTETVARGLGWPFVAATAFVLSVVAWQRWRDIGLQQLPTARSLLLAWLPALYIAGGFGLAVRFGLPPATVVLWVLLNTFLVGLSEELMFRGVLLQALRRTVALTTAAFGAVHSLNVFIAAICGGRSFSRPPQR